MKALMFADYADDFAPTDELARAELVRRVGVVVERLKPLRALEAKALPPNVLRLMYDAADDIAEVIDLLHSEWLIEIGAKKRRRRAKKKARRGG